MFVCLFVCACYVHIYVHAAYSTRYTQTHIHSITEAEIRDTYNLTYISHTYIHTHTHIHRITEEEVREAREAHETDRRALQDEVRRAASQSASLLREKEDELTQAAALHEEKLRRLSADLDALNADLDERKRALDNVLQRAERTRGESDILRQQLVKAEEDVSCARAALRDAERETARERDEREHVENKLEDAMRRLEREKETVMYERESARKATAKGGGGRGEAILRAKLEEMELILTAERQARQEERGAEVSFFFWVLIPNLAVCLLKKHIHAYIHTYIHTKIHTYIHT